MIRTLYESIVGAGTAMVVAASLITFTDWISRPTGPVTDMVSMVPVNNLGIPSILEDGSYHFDPRDPISVYSVWRKLRSCKTLRIDRWAVRHEDYAVFHAAPAQGLQTLSGDWGEVIRPWFPNGLTPGRYTFYKKVHSWCSEREPDQEPEQTVEVTVSVL